MAGRSAPPVDPVKPSGMELGFRYVCPFCGAPAIVRPAVRPATVTCLSCGDRFPIAPADAAALDFLRIMTADGRAAVDADFL